MKVEMCLASRVGWRRPLACCATSGWNAAMAIAKRGRGRGKFSPALFHVLLLVFSPLSVLAAHVGLNDASNFDLSINWL